MTDINLQSQVYRNTDDISELKAEMSRLQDTIHTLEAKVDLLIRITATQRTPTWPTDPLRQQDRWDRCSRCGMDSKNMSNYVCNDPQCPTFPRISCASYTTGGAP